MTKIVIRTDDVAGFFNRARDAAQGADRGQSFEECKITLSFEDPQRMFNVLTVAPRIEMVATLIANT
jgi:hypothetical protein